MFLYIITGLWYILLKIWYILILHAKHNKYTGLLDNVGDMVRIIENVTYVLSDHKMQRFEPDFFQPKN